MALGTPVAAAAAYSAASGTSVSPAYPAGILATDVVLLFVGQKPAAVGGGTVTTPTGWTLRDELTNAGGYAAQGADTGNTNLRVYSWNTPVAGQTGNLAVTIAGNDVTWAFIVRIPKGAGSAEFGSADGQRTTAPTSPMSIALTNGTSATNFQTGDRAIWAMVVPTDVTTPAQFSAQSITATGATFGTAAELNEPDSGTGNDIGGYSAWAAVTAGSSTTAPTVTATLAGTLTNVRGPVVLLRVREAPVLTPARYDNTQTFYAPTVTAGAVTLSPALYSNDQVFYAADVSQTGGAQNIQPGFYTNDQTFYAATVGRGAVSLTATRYDNLQTFFAPSVTTGAVTLTATRYDNGQTFYAATVSVGAVTLTPARYDNAQTFYSPVVSTGSAVLAPARYNNTNTFYAHTLTPGVVTLTAARLDNTNTFYAASIGSGASALFPSPVENTSQFYAPTVTPGAIALTAARLENTQTLYAPTVTVGAITLTPARLDNASTIYPPLVSDVPPQSLTFIDWVEPGHVEPGWVGWPYFNANQFFGAALTQSAPAQAAGGGKYIRSDRPLQWTAPLPFADREARRAKRRRDEILLITP